MPTFWDDVRSLPDRRKVRSSNFSGLPFSTVPESRRVEVWLKLALLAWFSIRPVGFSSDAGSSIGGRRCGVCQQMGGLSSSHLATMEVGPSPLV